MATAGIVGYSFFASALVDPVRSIEATSNNLSFENGDAGAWKITKSAKWIARGKAKITIEADSIAKDDNRPKDILLVMDTSGSMIGPRLTQAKEDIENLVTTLMTESDTRFGLVTFNSSSTLVRGLTDDRHAIVNDINNLTVYGQTNYYQAILRMEEIFEDYDFSAGRRPIVLFMTDGDPNVNAPLQVSEYQVFKTLYPDVSVRGIQYEVGEEIRQSLQEVTDSQWVADVDILRDVLWRAIAEDSYIYDNFVVTDYINDTYYTIDSAANISATLGSYSLEYDDTTPKITWDLSGSYHSGTKEKLEIDVKIRDQYYDEDDGRYPTNTRLNIQTSLRDTADENVTTEDTPILKLKYQVTMDNNVPDSSCTAHQTTAMHVVFDPVDMEYTTGEWCKDYFTHGWDLGDDSIIRIGSDYFLMPEQDVDLKAIWRKTTIEKSMEGELQSTRAAYLRNGESINLLLKNLVPGANATSHYEDHDSTIKAFKRAVSKPDDFDTRTKAKISQESSEFPIYAWLGNDGETVYYWSDAEEIYMSGRSNSIFEAFDVLEDISGLTDFDTTRVETLGWAFKGCTMLTDLSPIADWVLPKLTELTGIFEGAASLENIDALSGWRTPELKFADTLFYKATSLTSIAGMLDWGVTKVTIIRDMLRDASSLTSLHGLENWDASHITNADNAMWGCHSLTDITALTEWQTTSLTTMEYMLKDNYVLANLAPLAGWDVSNVTDFEGVFSFAEAVTDLSALADWNVSKGENFNGMFDNTYSLTDISDLAGWRPNNAKTMFGMFFNAKALESADGLEDWEIDGVTTLGNFFMNCYKLNDISALANWADHLDNVETISGFFSDNKILEDISPIADWTMPKVTDMSATFRGMKAVESYAPLTNWDTSKVTTMAEMFGWSNIDDLEPLRGWDVSKVENMKFLFHNCPGITTLEPIENWNVVSVTDINGIFRYLQYVTSLEPMRKWGQKLGDHLVDIQYAFEGMMGVTDISPLTNWDVSNVTNMAGALGGILMTNLDAIGSWDVSKVTDMHELFCYCYNLTDASAIENWNVGGREINMEKTFFDTSLTDYPSWYQE
ncbi:BspA family leucine-rich repeat surface protein [Candidatus Saccharibacteria bacterium]|nr:BspA family leucine-rich repeat surface protein [Candidatus Saccharibacteria bacterium]